jgi:tyrosine-protein kinase Etk/Wzc
MEKQERQDLSLAEILDIVQRRKLILLVSVLLAIIPVLLYNHVATPIYQANAIVAFEDYSKEMMPTFDFAGSVYRGNFVANRIQEVKTRTFAKEVYDELPDSVRKLFRFPDPLPSRFDAERHVVSLIRAGLSAELIKTTDLVNIAYACENPQLAKIVANTVTTMLQKNNLRIRRQEYTSVREFVDEQIRVVKDRLQQAEEALRDYKSHENITSLEDESKEILQRVTQAEVLYNQIQTEKDAQQKKLSVTLKKLDEQKQDLSSSITQINSPLTVKLKEKLVELEIRYSNLLVQNYPEDHPKMKDLKSEINQTKQALVQSTMQILQGEKLKGVIDPISQLQKYLEESIALDVELQAVGAEEAHLRKTLDNYSEHLKKLPDKELALVRLLRDKEVNNKIYTKLLEEREQARIREAAEIGNIRLIEPAEMPRGPTHPKKMLNLMIGIFTGITIGLALIFVREFLQEAPRTQEQVERILRLPVLTLVPKIKRGFGFESNGRYRERMLVDQNGTTSFMQDAYSYLWSSLQFSNRRRPLLVMITSSGPSEGKSTIASNLALTAARHGKKTVLLDGDLRKPVLHEIFGVSCAPGLRNLVVEANQTWPSLALPASIKALPEPETSTASELRAEESFRSFHEMIFPALDNALQATEMENLRILTMGDPLLAPDVFWTSPVTEEILSMLRRIAEFIVIDTPPVIGMPDASIITRYCDGVLFCVAAGETDKTILLRVKKILEQTGNKLWGVVLNKVDPNVIYGTSKYYKQYAKYYGKGKRHRKRKS